MKEMKTMNDWCLKEKIIKVFDLSKFVIGNAYKIEDLRFTNTDDNPIYGLLYDTCETKLKFIYVPDHCPGNHTAISVDIDYVVDGDFRITELK
jgi:hypothetical protein